MKFEQNINEANVRFTRTDTQKSIDVFYNQMLFHHIEDMNYFYAKVFTKNATVEEKMSLKTLARKGLKKFSQNIDKIVNINQLLNI